MIAILGGGFSGISVAIRLAGTGVEHMLFEPGSLGGRAYNTDHPLHLLNVPAGRMSLWPEEPGHFAAWAQLPEHEFAPRRLYGEYLRAELEASGANIRPAKLDRLEGAPGAWRVPDGVAKHVVLACGYAPATALDPYAPKTWPDRAGRVLIAGTGLTAADAAVTALDRYPDAQVTCISPRGRFPEPFLEAEPVELGPPPTSLRPLVRWIRDHVQSVGYAPVYEALRGRWQSLYEGLSRVEQAQFIRHLSPIHDRFRHRLPPSTHARLVAAKDRLAIRSGKVVRLDSGQAELADGERISADLILDARGHRVSHPLVSDLVARFPSASGPHGIGLSANPEGEVTGVPTLWCLGPLRRGQLWETTAVREIRMQASQIAAALTS